MRKLANALSIDVAKKAIVELLAGFNARGKRKEGMLFWATFIHRASGDGCLVDALNGCIQRGVKLRIGLLAK